MREATTHPDIRKAIKTAHDERGATLRLAFGWLFPSKSSR